MSDDIDNVKAGAGVGCVVLGLIALGIIGWRSFETVDAGYVGVGTRFGAVVSDEYGPGLNFKSPLVSLTPFDVRLRETKETLTVPTKEGLTATLDVSVLYRVIPAKADEVYSKIGGIAGKDEKSGKDIYSYETTVVQPYTRNIVRDVIAAFGSEDLYNPSREKIGGDIRERLAKELEPRGIVLESVLLRDVKLPDQVVHAIEQKMRMKQESEQMEFVLSKAKQEADRQRVEAQGIADAQKIISGSLSEAYLQWKFISTLDNIDKGPNKTVVIVPFDQKLMPLLPVGEGK